MVRTVAPSQVISADDLYGAIFGQFSYGSRAHAPKDGDTDNDHIGSLDNCGGNIKKLTGWLIGGIAQAVNPDDSQRALLNELQAVTAKALDILKAGCPTELPSSPVGESRQYAPGCQ